MTYNSERFIARAIDSCMSQTFQDFEICIADDASTDSTVEIIRKYQDKFPGRIKLHVQPTNMGRYSLAINGNAGRAMCAGEYLAILDGDEYMAPDRLEKQVAFLDEYPEFIAVSHNKKHVEFATGKECNVPVRSRKKELTTKNLILHGNLFDNCYMMRNINMMADTSLKVLADLEFIIRLSMQGKLGFQNEKLTIKLWHGDNVTITRRKQFAEDRLITLALLEYRHPQLLRYINVRRARHYLSEVRKGDWRYLPPSLSHPFSFIWAYVAKYF